MMYNILLSIVLSLVIRICLVYGANLRKMNLLSIVRLTTIACAFCVTNAIVSVIHFGLKVALIVKESRIK
jgi:hypothetical protein